MHKVYMSPYPTSTPLSAAPGPLSISEWRGGIKREKLRLLPFSTSGERVGERGDASFEKMECVRCNGDPCTTKSIIQNFFLEKDL
jgi:hypothetical protein